MSISIDGKRIKGQVWLIEYSFALLFFTVALLLFFRALPEAKNLSARPFDNVYDDARTVAQAVSDAGYPGEWNSSTVKYIGLADSGRNISATKVAMFHGMSDDNYSRAKAVLGIDSDFALYFLSPEDDAMNISNISVIGSSELGIDAGGNSNISGIKANDVVMLERLMLHDKRPVRVVVLAWS